MSIKTANIYAPTPNTERGKPTRLTTSAKGENLVYCSGNSVIIRNVKNPLQVDVFSQHRADTTVARVAPSGNYCASADIEGNIFVWDTLNKVEHIIKLRKRSFHNGVTDLAWSEDNQRIFAVGDGKSVKGEVFTWDSGTSVGDISGHTSRINCCAYRQQRPYRVVTGSDDKLVNFYAGPPFKYVHSAREQQRFVNTVEYSPDGSIFVASGGDHNIYVYDGKEGTKISQFSATDEHKMAIYSVAFSPDGKQLVSASADKTAKVWNVGTGTVVATYTLGADLYDTPMGAAWTVIGPAVVTLRGDIVFFDPASPSDSKPIGVWRGHHKAIGNINYYPPAAGEEITPQSVNFVTTSGDGQVLEYSAVGGAQAGLKGFPHGGKPTFGAVYSSALKKTASLGSDDTLLIQNSTNNPEYAPGTPASSSSSTSAAKAAAEAVTAAFIAAGAIKVPIKQPKTVALLPCKQNVVVASVRGLTVVALATGAVVISVYTNFDIVSIAVGAENKAGGNALVVVGGADHKTHFYTFNGKELKEYAVTKGVYPGGVNAVAISPDGTRYAAARDRFIAIGNISNGEVTQENLLLHTAKINALDFSPDGKQLLSGGLDSFFYVWDLSNVDKYLKVQGAHAPQGVYTAKWVDDTTFISGGGDFFIRTWKITQ